MKTNHYFYDLPEDYKCVKVIDAKNKKTSILFVLGSLVLTLLVFGIGLIIFMQKYNFDNVIDAGNIVIVIVFILSMFLYIVLHELTHGLFYKIFTHEKLTYGFTLTVAYCGVPNLYVKRKAAIITTLAPFVVFNIVFLVPIFFIPNLAIKFLLIVLFAFHFGGCIGDLWVAIYLIFKNRDKQVIVNDTGPKQTFYVKVEDYENQVS